MKRNFRKILTVVTALLFALPLLLIAVSCKSVEPRSEADVIPETLGTAEGLWLYKGNRRTRTDGTEEEKLLTSLTVNETEYGAEDFRIVSYLYVTVTYEIFYIVQIETDCRLCHYNYLTKESSDLYDLPDTERPRDYHMKVSKSLVYVWNDEIDYGVIFSRNAQLLYEDYYGTLDGDIVYRFEGEDFVYYRKGEKNVVTIGVRYSDNEYERYGDYVYFFSASRYAYAVDLEAAKCTKLAAFSTSDDKYRYNNDSYYMNGSLFVISGCYSTNHDNDERLYQLIRITGTSTEVAYDFGNVPYGVTMYIDGDTIYLVKGAGREIEKRYFAYDSITGKTKRVSARAVKNGKSTEDLKKEAAAKKKDFTVGDYTFYVESIGYDDQPQMFGTAYTKTCYYLMRRYGDTEEVMQYSLNRNNGYFYDDICEF